MKLHEPTWTSEYTAVAAMNPLTGPHFAENVRCTYPRQNISSAGPITNNSSADSSHGEVSPLKSYMWFTSGRPGEVEHQLRQLVAGPEYTPQQCGAGYAETDI